MRGFNFFKKNNLDKKKLSTVKKIKISLFSIFTILLVVLFISLAGLLNNSDKKLKNKLITSPELARAMTYDQFVDGDENIEGTDNVKFSAFFLRDLDGDGYAEKIKGTCKELGKQDTLYMELNVLTAGKLINGKIEIQDENFYLATSLPKDSELKNSYISQNTKLIEFNEIANGTQKMITGSLRSGDYTSGSLYTSAIGNDTTNYSKRNTIVFTGTYIDEFNNETEIRKEINLDIDWYGTAVASFYSTSGYYYDLPSRIDEENQTLNLHATISPSETKNQLLLKDNYVEGTIPELNGFAPVEVACSTTGITFNYDESTKQFIITKEASIDENGVIINNAYMSSSSSINNRTRYNSYGLDIKYPLEAYETLGLNTVTISIPVKTYWEGYNNVNSEFTNPYKSNEANATITTIFNNPRVYEANVDVTVGTSVSNPSRYIVSKKKPVKLYNQISEEEKDDYYPVKWYVYTGTNGEYEGLTFEEQSGDTFIKVDNTTELMEDVLTNKGIGFSGADNLLGKDGWIKVYDIETEELLVTFTKDGKDGSLKWGEYTSSKIYKYTNPVKHVRIVTSATTAGNSMYIYHQKELDDSAITEKYTREEFDNLKNIRSNLKVTFAENKVLTDSHQAIYEMPFSVATIALSNDVLSTQVTEKNEEIKITANANTNYNQVPWKNGSFLVKFPDEIVNIEINNITINNNKVKISSYEQIKNENGRFIKINTENLVEEAQSYTITINANLSPDPRIATVQKNIELWASNEEAEDYYYKAEDTYDVNDNLDMLEIVNKASTKIDLKAPNSLLIAQTASEFDDKNTEVVSPQIADIRPQYAVVDGEENTAKIGIFLKNNYSSTISEIKLIGVIPFEGNDYVISGKDLNSTFTTKMTSAGLTLPAELVGHVSVYYSTKESPNKELTDTSNEWTLAEDVENWNNIKTFMVDFEDYVLDAAKAIKFEYTVSIPNGLDFNLLSYSEAGVYFSLDTEQGKYLTKTEPNKLGFRIAEKYNLVLEKYHAGKSKLIPGATYLIIKEGDIEGKTAVTDENGRLEITNLYAEEIYSIQEIKTPEDYDLNDSIVRFVGHVDENGILTIEKFEGAIRDNITVTKQVGEDYKATVKVEDEAKAKLKIIKVDNETNGSINKVRFKITGQGLPEKGKTITTNNVGETTIKGLKVGEEYTIEEIKAEGYYLNKPIKFKIKNVEGNYAVEITNDGTQELIEVEGQNPVITTKIIEHTAIEDNNMPIGIIKIGNEKIPTYNLVITKIKSVTKATATPSQEGIEENENEEEITYVEGAKFKLYKDQKEIGTYISDATGHLYINNLYQYVEEKGIDQTYILKEVLVPEGYSKVKDIKFKVEKENEKLKFIEELEEGQTLKEYSVEGDTVNVTVEDNPSFKIIKTDGETGETLPNTKFAIYNLEGEFARNSKGEILGNKEIINGEEYHLLTTDQNGEITADLPEGLYKAIEVQASDIKYDITNKEWYFGIGASKKVNGKLSTIYTNTIGGSAEDCLSKIEKTNDGGYICIGNSKSKTIELDETITFSQTYRNGLVIKYDEENNIEWHKELIQTSNGLGNIYLNSIIQLDSGDYIIGGISYGETIIIDDLTFENLSNKGIFLKLDNEGDLVWLKTCESIEVGDGEFSFNDVCELPNEEIILVGYSSENKQTSMYYPEANIGDGILLVIDGDGNTVHKKIIENTVFTSVETINNNIIISGFSYNTNSIEGINVEQYGEKDACILITDLELNLLKAHTYGGTGNDVFLSSTNSLEKDLVFGGYFNSPEFYIDDSIINNSSANIDGIVLNTNLLLETKWSKSIKGTSDEKVECVKAVSDGGVLIAGEFKSNSVTIDDLTANNKNNGSYDGVIAKCDADGNMESMRSIGGTQDDKIISIEEIDNGDYVAGGYCNSNNWTVNGKDIINTKGSNDEFIARFKEEEIPGIKISNVQTLSASGSADTFSAICATNDGGYIAGGYYTGAPLILKDTIIEEHVSRGLVVVKFSARDQIEWYKILPSSNSAHINKIIQTGDNGYIIGGYFYGSITLQNEVVSTNGLNDGIIIKLDANGEVEWETVVGGRFNDEIIAVEETDNNTIFVGAQISRGEVVLDRSTFINTQQTNLIAEYDMNGNLLEKLTFGDQYVKMTHALKTKDGGYFVAGNYSNDARIDEEHFIEKTKTSSSNPADIFLIKYNNGNIDLIKTYGNVNEEVIHSIIETQDNNYLIRVWIPNGPIDFGNYVIADGGEKIIKIDTNGEYIFDVDESNYRDFTKVLYETKENNYIIFGKLASGIRLSNDGFPLKKDDNHGYFFAEISPEGTILNLKELNVKYGFNFNDYAILKDGRIVIASDYNVTDFMIEDKFLVNTNSQDGGIITFTMDFNAPSIDTLEIENTRKEYKITTDIKEIDGIKGGTISGEDIKPFEIVKYGDTNTEEIKMIPNENYEIIGITVNGKEWLYDVDADGSYTMPAFENMTEDKHIVVTYSLKDNKITINKKDSINSLGIEGSKFKLDQIEERAEPNNDEIIGELTPNGSIYKVSDYDKEVENFIDLSTDLKHVEGVNYYFVPKTNEDSSISYVPTNSKTWQTENVEGATSGVHGTTANSYVELDLSEMTGTYKVVVNGYAYSESSDYGYATISTDVNSITDVNLIPKYNYTSSPNSRFIYLSGTTANAITPRDRESTIVLNGGQKYYLHVGYRKDGSIDTGEDQFVINSIKLYETKDVQYGFEEKIIGEGAEAKTVYQSTNEGTYLKTANACIPINLENYTGKYNITVNAEVSTDSGEYGYVTINKTESPAPSYSANSGDNKRIIYITSSNSAEQTLEVDGGYKYYLHMGYFKDDYINTTGGDYFRVNSINVSLSDSQLYHTTVTTNSDGSAITQIPFGKYKITEIATPEDYVLKETPIIKDNDGNILTNEGIVEFRAFEGSTHEFTIENEKYAHVKVHHIAKDTGEKVAEDEDIIGRQGEKYTTSPKVDISRYEIEKDPVTGKEILPSNKDGIYTHQDIDVTYYYVPRKINLTVHHYIVDSSIPVPLANGENAEDVVSLGNENESYTTLAISNELLSDEYELVGTPDNATGTYQYPEVEVTYYYKKINRTVEINKVDSLRNLNLGAATFGIYNDANQENFVAIGKLTNNSNYPFIKDGESYISGGKSINSAVSTSYIPIDMRDATENVTVKIDAEISSERNSDFGYVFINESTVTPAYSNPTDRVFRITGTESIEGVEKVLVPGKIYYLHMGYRKDVNGNEGLDRFKINKIEFENAGNVTWGTTDENGKITTDLETGTYYLKEIEAPDNYVLNQTPRVININRDTDKVELTVDNEMKKGTVKVNHFVEGTTNPILLSDGTYANTEEKEGFVGDIYATKPVENLIARYELVDAYPENSSGEYIDGEIEVTYFYREIPTSVLVHHYLLDRNGQPTTTPVKKQNGELAEDVLIEGHILDNYTTGMVIPLDKYEVANVPANANGVMTGEQIVVTYYYRLKDTSVTVNYYIEGTENKVPLIGGGTADRVVIEGKVDDTYTTNPASNVQTKYELVAEPTNKSGTMTVEPITVNYYYRLKETGVDVHYYLLDNQGNETTNKVLHTDGTEVQDVVITGRVDDSYSTVEASNVMSKYRLVRTTNNTSGIMTEDRITVIYYYQLKDTSVLVHHYLMDLEGNLTENRVLKQDGTEVEDVTILGKVDDHYTTIETTDKASKYELVSEPNNKSGNMTEAQIVVNYYYRTKETTVTAKHLLVDREGNPTNENVPNRAGGVVEDVVTTGRIDSRYQTTDATSEIDNKYELDTSLLPNNSRGTMTEEPIIVRYYYRIKDAQVRVHHYINNTTTEVPDRSGGRVSSETIDGRVGDYYTTRPASNVVDYYEVVNNPSNKEGTMTVEPIEVIYYYDLKDYGYIVNHLDIVTEEPIEETDNVSDVRYGTRINISEKVKTIDGYNYETSDPEEFIVSNENNILNLYYRKRADLSYKVNYLEKGSNEVIKAQKQVDNMTFKDRVRAAGEIEDIDGYNFDSLDVNGDSNEEFLTIGTSDNVINIYYTKRNDLSYTVNYLEEGTNKVISDQKQVGNMTFKQIVKAEDEVIDIYGYNFDHADIEELEISTGENVINLYYKVKNAKVIVHYLEIDTEKELSDDVTIEGKVYDDYQTEEASDIPAKYVLVQEPDNARGMFREEDQEVTYYYIKRKTKVTVHHYQDLEETGGEIIALSRDVEIEGRVDDEYETHPATDIPIKFEFTSDMPDNSEGTMTIEPIEVTYYYTTKKGKVTFRYIDVDTGEPVADPEEQNGKVDETYRTDPKDVDGYTYVDVEGEPEGRILLEETEVIFYYKLNTKVTIKYIDINTGEEIDDRLCIGNDYDEDEEEVKDSTIEINGLLGDEFDTTVKAFDGYKLVEEPDEIPEKMTKEEIVLIYKYVHVSEGLIERHIDTITKKLLEPETLHEGDEGDPYKIESKEFDGYDLVEEKMPENSEGKFAKDTITVTYEYIKKSKVIVKYIDVVTGEDIFPEEPEDIIDGHQNDPYETEARQKDDYVLEEIPDNSKGDMTDETIVVVYKYRHISGGVVINYLDIANNKQIADEEKQEGYEGLSYTTEPKEIDEYVLVEEKYPENSKGTFTIDTIYVNYYYKRKARVKIIYVDKKTNEEIEYTVEDEKVTTTEEEEGFVGDEYSSEEKDIPGYVLVEVPNNKDGTLKVEETEVVYMYARKAKVIARYTDKETGEPLATEEEQEGFDGADYDTEEKDVKYYKLVEVPKNKDGSMEVNITVDENTGKEIVDDTVYVDYKYVKKEFNLKVDKKIKKLLVNNQTSDINSDIGKYEIYRKDVGLTKVKLVYVITVTNDGELTGRADIVENIPAGMVIDDVSISEWTQKNGKAVRNTKDIKPGETKQYEIILDWTNAVDTLGTKVNVVTLEDVQNDAGFEEKDLRDNTAKAEMVLIVGTGSDRNQDLIEAVVLVLLLFGIGVCLTYLIKNKQAAKKLIP